MTPQQEFITRRVRELLAVGNIGELQKFLGADPKQVADAVHCWQKIKEEFYANIRAGFNGVSWNEVCRFRNLIVRNLADKRVPYFKRK